MQAQLRRGQALQQQLELQQLEPESQFVLHLVVLLHLLVFAPQLQNQVLLGCLTDLQLVLRQLEQLEQQQVFVRFVRSTKRSFQFILIKEKSYLTELVMMQK